MLRENIAPIQEREHQRAWLPECRTCAAAQHPRGPCLVYCSTVTIMKFLIIFAGDPPDIFIFHWALQIM